MITPRSTRLLRVPDLRAMQGVEIVHAPAVAVEGKAWQREGAR